MHLIQILLPLRDNEGRDFGAAAYGRVRGELAERFGEVTAFTRAPAEGIWKEDGQTSRDDIVVVEVMVEAPDRAWWRAYRADLEGRFRQDAIVVRAMPVEIL
jgi:hypothetical protein